MPERNPPILTYSKLTGQAYIATSWRRLSDGTVVAYTKHDVTDQLQAIIAALSDPKESPDA